MIEQSKVIHFFVLNQNMGQQAFLSQYHRVKGLNTRVQGNEVSIQIKRE